MKSIFLTLTVILLAASITGCTKKEPTQVPAEKIVAAVPSTNDTTDTPVDIEATPEEPEQMPAPAEETPAAEPAQPDAQKSLVRKAASLDGLTYIKGEPVAFKEGKVYVVEFWATWCGPCRVTIPHLTEVQKQYKDKGVTVIGISSEETIEPVKNFVTQQGEAMNYTVAWDPQRKVNTGYMGAFGQKGIPTAFIVDGKGTVAWYGHPLDGMDAVLEKVVAGDFDAVAYAKEKAANEALQQELYELFQQYFVAVLNGKSLEEARPIAEKFIEKGSAEALNALAWEILTQAPEKSDKAIALKAAEKANAQTKGENPMVLDTYALALFENGKIDEAVAVQEKAVALTAGNEQLQADLMTRLEKYKDAVKSSS